MGNILFTVKANMAAKPEVLSFAIAKDKNVVPKPNQTYA